MLSADFSIARIQTNDDAHCKANESTSAQRVDLHGRFRYSPRASFCPVRALYRPQSASEADEGRSNQAVSGGTEPTGSECAESGPQPVRHTIVLALAMLYDLKIMPARCLPNTPICGRCTSNKQSGIMAKT